jgi:hypothetical protein
MTLHQLYNVMTALHIVRVSELQTVAALMPAVREEETPRNYVVFIPTLARRDA